MKMAIFTSVIFSASTAAIASSAEFKCENNQPVLKFSATTGLDAGKPGLFWVGVHTPDQKYGYFFNAQGTWDQYTGGLYTPHKRFDSGLPPSIQMRIPIPSQMGADSSDAYVGWEIYAGHGALTKEDEAAIKSRRIAISEARKSGQNLADSEYNSDERFAWGLVQKNMVDNKKYYRVIVVPQNICPQSPSRTTSTSRGEKP